jgi:ribulose 1,5-bisphosphate synthetase/thiazole synthase
MAERQYIEINNVFAIVKMDEGDFILAEVKIDKETKEKYYPTRAIYSNELKLVADLINLSVKRGVFLKTITSISELMKESHRIAELAQQVLNQLNSKSEQ